MLKPKPIIFIVILLLLAPFTSQALVIPKDGSALAAMSGINAQAYEVMDVQSGQVLISKNPNMAWVPASLTKLVTALVVLDTKPNMNKSFAMATSDQVLGACSDGGACIRAKSGVKYTVGGLFHAALMPSANNAASALARSTGLSMADFVARMNQKAQSLGATNTHFNEPTGHGSGKQHYGIGLRENRNSGIFQQLFKEHCGN